MNNNYKLKICLSIFLISFLLTINGIGQTLHIDPATDGGFELPGGFAGNGWTVVNDISHQWAVGTATFASGTNGAYISNDGGATNSYTLTTQQTSHFYKDITIPAGESAIMLNFSYRGTGESGFDRMLVYTATTGVTPTAGAPVSSSTTLAGATLIYTSPVVASYQNVSLQLPAALAGTTVRLIFTWQNDNSAGSNPAAAIDNISLTSQIPAPLNGIYTIDNTQATSPTIPTNGGNFNSFADAINYLNLNGISGSVTFNVVAGETFTESSQTITTTGTLATPIIFQRSGAGANPIFLASNGTGTTDGAFTINGADYITFDGINVNDNPSNATNATKMEYGYLIKNSSPTDGAQNITIKNLTISLDRANTGTYGIFQNALIIAPLASSGSNSNNIYDNVSVQNSYRGIHLTGNASFPDALCEIKNCTIGSASANDIGGAVATQTFGIRSTSSSGIKIHHNVVRNITANTTVDGILLEVAQGNSEIYNNKVSSIRNGGTASTSGVTGIRANVASTGTQSTKVYNNFVSNITSGYTGAATATRVIRGIYVQSAGNGAVTSVHNIDFNTVSIDGSASSNVSSACFEIGTASGPIMNVRNNIFANYTGAQAGVAKHYTWRSTSATVIGSAGSVSNYNDLFISNTTNGFVGLGNATDLATLANWQTTMTQDANSLSTNPVLTNINSDLHSAAVPLDGAANMASITWVTDDIDSQLRNNPTDIGADDFDLSACSGTPAPGNTLSSLAAVCPSTSFTLSFSVNLSALTGITYQWQSSPDGVLYSNIIGATNASYTTTQSSNTYYQAVVTCINSGLNGTSVPFQVTMSPLSSCYCVSSATNNAAEDIFNVSLATLNNSSTCATTGGAGSVINQYSDYTGTVAAVSVTQATSYPFSVQVGTCGGNFSNATRIFIDFNQNGLFTDAGETVYTSATSTSGAHSESGNINIPVSATAGTTRMRVVTVQTSTPTSIASCGTYTSGETEDYLIDIIAALPCAGTPSPGITQTTVASVCPGTSFTLNISTPPYGVTGITYQWQSSSDGITYTNISGATGVTYTTTQSTATYYQNVVTCANSGSNGTSTPLHETMNPFSMCFCASTATSGVDEDIFKVQLGTLNNSSTCATTGGAGSVLNKYSDYTAIAAPDLMQSVTYPLAVQIGTCGGNFNNAVAVFIDYNHNGLLTDPGETAYISPTFTNGPHVENGNITIPVGATTGNTLMRVINKETSTPGSITPCGTYTYGETEDYVINIIPLPPNPPTPVQDPAIPTCAAGTNLTVPGIPTAGFGWFWQIAANGTSSANPVSGPYTVYLDRTYYVRTYDAVHNVWSLGSDSVTVTNIPLAPTPPVPTAGANPACVNTLISMSTPPTGTGYFWQGAISNGASNSQNASTSYAVNSTGTYYVAAYDSVTSCWSNTNNISVVIDSYVPAAPTVLSSSISVCQVSSTAQISAAPPASGSIQASFGNALISSGVGASTYNTTVSALPTGAVITGTQLKIYGANALGSSYQSEIRVALSGATTLAPTQISTLGVGGIVTPNPVITIPNLPLAGGAVTLSLTETADDGGNDASFDSIKIVINYTLPVSSINWWNASLGGTLQGSGSPFETIGTTQLPNSNTAGTFTFYAASKSGACLSSRVPVNVIVNPLPVMVLNDAAICSGDLHLLDAQNSGSTYLWNSSETTQTISTTIGGWHYVDITTAAGCTARDSMNLTINNRPIVNLGADVSFCIGDSILLDAANTGFTFVWNDATTNQTLTTSAGGNYFVTVTNPLTTCTSSDTILVTVNQLPVINLGVNTGICIGDSLILDAGNPGSSYSWNNSSTNQTITVHNPGTYFVFVADPVSSCYNSDTIVITQNTLPVVSIGADTAICNGSSLVLNAGHPGSTYIWNNASTGQTLSINAAGTYSVVVVDQNGCKGNDAINITLKSSPVVNLGTDTTRCGGPILLNAGNTGSTFLWNNSSTGQTLTANATGTYYVAVTSSNGCSKSDSIGVTINSLPVVNLGNDTLLCGGSLTLNSANTGLNHLWSDNSTGQTLTVFTTGTFSVTVTNPLTGCASSDAIVVTFNQKPVVNLGNDSAQCAGSITLNAGSGGSVLWNTGATTSTINVTTSGMYYAKVTNGGCSTSDTVLLTINPLPVVGFPAIADVCFQGLPFTMNATPTGGTFTGGAAVNGIMFDPTTAGVGTHPVLYSYTDANSCSNSITQNIHVADCTGIEEYVNSNDVNVFPNPSNGMFTINITNANFNELTVSISNIQGKEIYNFTERNINSDYNKQIDLEGVAKGVYFIKINTGTELKIQKLIIN
jgi:hypothetical protein